MYGLRHKNGATGGQTFDLYVWHWQSQVHVFIACPNKYINQPLHTCCVRTSFKLCGRFAPGLLTVTTLESMPTLFREAVNVICFPRGLGVQVCGTNSPSGFWAAKRSGVFERGLCQLWGIFGGGLWNSDSLGKLSAEQLLRTFDGGVLGSGLLFIAILWDISLTVAISQTFAHSP